MSLAVLSSKPTQSCSKQHKTEFQSFTHYICSPPSPSVWLGSSPMFSHNAANIALRGKLTAVSARCLHSSTSICTQQSLLARGNSSAHPAGDVEGGEWSRCCCPGEGGGCRMRPVLSQGRIFLWQMGSGLQHSLFDCHLSLAVSQSPVPPGPGAIWGGLDV